MHLTGVSAIMLGAACMIGTPVLLFGWLWIAERVFGKLPQRASRTLRPAVWLAPALLILVAYLLWPMVYTGILSFRNATAGRWTGLANFQYLIDDRNIHFALRNNTLWLVLFVGGCTAIGLIVALLSDKVRYEGIAKAFVVAPLAISFVSGAVIWRLMYAYNPPGLPQVGTVNAALTTLSDAQPVAWLVNPWTNNTALIAVGVWMTAGFATVILSAALKGLPADVSDAALVDGASRWQELWYVVLPQLRPTLVVVATLLAIEALKAFDIVYVMTNGSYNTNVIANILYQQLFVAQDLGKASAIAVLLTVFALPLIILNARSQRSQERWQ